RDRRKGGQRRVSLLQPGAGNRPKRAVPDEQSQPGGAMIVTRKHLSRRTFLRGAGAVIGLPLLDAMTPALGWARGPAREPPLRLCSAYVPNGMVMPNWMPATTGRRFELTPILRPLERFREHTLVLSGLMCHNANALGDGPGDHARASASFLTGA